MIVHGGLVALRLQGRWAGALIQGPSGAGKSDLALRMLGHGAQLVADDRVILWISGGRLFGRAPETLHGLLEVRGHEMARVTALPLAEVVLAVRCGTPERLPDPAKTAILGVDLPLLALDPVQASAPAKLRRALLCFDGANNRRI